MEVKEGCSDQSRERGRGAEELDLDRPGSELGKTPGPCLPVSAAAGSGSPGLLEGGRERESGGGGWCWWCWCFMEVGREDKKSS